MGCKFRTFGEGGRYFVGVGVSDDVCGQVGTVPLHPHEVGGK